MKAVIVKTLEIDGRICLIRHIDLGLPPNNTFQRPWHNGYIETKQEEYKDDYLEYPISCEELTFQGSFPEYPDKNFIGFDTAHYWNMENPDSQTQEAVEKKIYEIIEELKQV